MSARAMLRALSTPALAFAGVLLALSLSGCGMSLMGHRAPAALGGPKVAKATRANPEPPKGFANKVAEAAEQAALVPMEPYWPYRIGQLQFESDSFAVAEASLKSALARNPSYVPALALLSRLYYQQKRHTEAVAMLDAARPRFAGGLPAPLAAGLALHYDALGQAAAARTAIATVPENTREAGSAVVYMRLQSSHPDSAIAPAKAALDHDGRSAVNHNNWGITRLRAGDPEGARKAFERAIDLDPKLAGPYYNLAILEKYYLFRDAEAAKWFGLYWERSHADPDGLAATFGKLEMPATAGGKDD